MKTKPLLILLTSLLIVFFLLGRELLPKGDPVAFSPLPAASKTVLVPLDGRPPCTKFVSDLAAIASVEIILPPKASLGNYNDPGSRELVYDWLSYNLASADSAIVSADFLIHGGLVGSRLPLGTAEDEERFFAKLSSFKTEHLQKRFHVFSIIPRLLISDQLIPDSWWQWHLMRWAELQDVQNTFGDPVSFAELRSFDDEIPEEIRRKYTALYKNNRNFNHKLLDLASAKSIDTLIIGQDDGQPFGLPNLNRREALFYLEHNKLVSKYHTTRGADEIACLLLASDRNRIWNYRPKVYVEYSSPAMAEMVMPFMPCSVGETVNEKITLIGGQIVKSSEAADFALYVHCGSGESPKLLEIYAERLKQLVSGNIPVALTDLTANYNISETLFPYLISNDTPLVRLAAFAGWNTVSNSVGTAVAQASIFTWQKKHLPMEELPKLHALNLKFNLERFFDDWVYQKALHHQLGNLLKIREIDPYTLGDSQEKTAHYIKREMSVYKNTLLGSNLRRHSFYSTDSRDFYLDSLEIDLFLPWERIFEVELSAKPLFVVRRK